MKGYVINAAYFIFGFKEILFAKPNKELKHKISNIFEMINYEYKDHLIKDIEYDWLFGSYAPKYGVWIPSYVFQCPVKSLDKSIEISEMIISELKKLHKKYVPIVIAIAYGDIKLRDMYMMGDGSAYVKSGRFIDNLKKCQNMINNKENIKIIE